MTGLRQFAGRGDADRCFASNSADTDEPRQLSSPVRLLIGLLIKWVI